MLGVIHRSCVLRQVSTRLRLLRLPEAWRSRVISGEITASQVRDLVLPFADLPEAMEAIDLEVKSFKPEEGETLATELQFLIGAALDGMGVSLSGYRNGQSYNVPDTEGIAERFGVRTVPPAFQGDSPIVVAFRTKEFEAFLDAEIVPPVKSKPKKHAPGNDTASPQATQPAKPRTAAEDKAIYEKRLYRYQIGWLQRTLADQVAGANDAQRLRWVLGMMQQHPGYNAGQNRASLFQAALAEVAGKKTKGRLSDVDEWAAVYKLADEDLAQFVTAMLRGWCDLEARSWSSDALPRAIELVAVNFGIKFEMDWKLDREFLELHTVEQLVALAREWGCGLKLMSPKKKDLVAELFAQANKARLPKCLKSLKPCTLD